MLDRECHESGETAHWRSGARAGSYRGGKVMARVLLVEDNEMNRDMLSRRLARNGHEVILAVDGKEGLDKATSENPDIILLDISLPLMTGHEVVQHIRSNPVTKSLLVIALTAH